MNHDLSRRQFTAAALALGLAGPTAAQQDYPSRPIRVIVPVPPGGAADTLARVMADRLGARWGQTVVVENRAGAGGNIGAEVVHKAAGDGHTLLLSPPGPLSINKLLYRSITFDSDTFVPVSIVAANPNVLLVHPKVPARTVQELIAHARANPNKLNYASSGAGSTTHLAGELFKSMARVDIVHIPYKGGPPAFSDLLAGQVEIMFQGLATALPQIKEGKVRVLAVGADKRHPALPDVPTLTEILPGFVTTSWTGLVASPGTPPAIAARIAAAVSEVFANPETARQVKGLDARDLVLNSPAEAARFIRDEKERWGAVIRSTGTTID
jgi:tripartite-type tricarboxylate transporter receptor subunit TctC